MANPAGVDFEIKTNIDRKGIEPTQVTSISLLSDLDDGAANDGSGTIKEKSGVVLGKTYQFKVESYSNGDPRDKSLIKWAVSYTNTETGQYHRNVLEDPAKATGDTISINFKDTNMCGHDFEVKAYINDLENEGKIKLFKHNRFRFFDKVTFENELEARKNNPKLIDQSATSLCGTAAILYIYAKTNPANFSQAFKKFFRTGTGNINSFQLSPNEEIFEMKPEKGNEDYPHFKSGTMMPKSDWVTLVGTRSSDNKSYTGKDGEDWDAINWPSYMVKAASELQGAAQVMDKTHFITGLNYSDTLKNIEKDFNEGWHIILLIDSDMLNDSVSIFGSLTNYHWIVYNGCLSIDDKAGTYSFSYYCWATEYNNKVFRSRVFNTNFYGYIKYK